MTSSALLDACVLLPIRTADLLLRLAKADLYRPLWSGEVLDEVQRNLGKLDVPIHLARRRVGKMRNAFPDAEISGYEWLLPTMTNHPKDRHVLAAATYARAEVIVTANLKDFPAAALEPCGVKAIHPDEFFMDLFTDHRDDVVQSVQQQIAALRNPSLSLDEFCTGLAREAPTFTGAVRPHLA